MDHWYRTFQRCILLIFLSSIFAAVEPIPFLTHSEGFITKVAASCVFYDVGKYIFSKVLEEIF